MSRTPSKIEFPMVFTLRELEQKNKDLKMTRIGFYQRVKQMVKSGELTVVTSIKPKDSTRGRAYLVYAKEGYNPNNPLIKQAQAQHEAKGEVQKVPEKKAPAKKKAKKIKIREIDAVPVTEVKVEAPALVEA